MGLGYIKVILKHPNRVLTTSNGLIFSGTHAKDLSIHFSRWKGSISGFMLPGHHSSGTRISGGCAR
jgi:hypothetical protein